MPKRYELTEAQWQAIKDLLPAKEKDQGRTAKDNRTFVNGVLWVLRSGAYWCHIRHDNRSRSSVGGLWKRGSKNEALGRSRGGLSTKIHMLADALGRPVRFIITAGQRSMTRPRLIT